MPSGQKPPSVAELGIIDLRDRDLQKEGPIALDGQWELYWMQSIPQEAGVHPDGYFSVPGNWIGHVLPDKSKLGAFGHAVFRLKVLMPSRARSDEVGLYLQEANTAYAVYCNGKFAFGGGAPKTTRAMSVPSYMPGSGRCEADNEIEILLSISNYHHRTLAGPSRHLYLGKLAAIENLQRGNVQAIFFVIGVVFVIGLYQVFYYSLRREELVPLWFGLFCFAIGARVVLNSRIIEINFPGVVSWDLLIKAEYAVPSLAAFFFVKFWNSLFPPPARRHFTTALQAALLAFALFSMVVSGTFVTGLLNVLILLVGAVLVWAAAFLIRAMLHERTLILWLELFSFLFLAFCVANDILFTLKIIETADMTHWGIFLFLVFQAMIIAVYNSRARASMEYLSENLLYEVQKRTKELNNSNKQKELAMEKLAAANDNLNLTIKELQDAHRIASNNLDMAVQVQASYFPQHPPRSSEWEIAHVYSPMAGE